MKVLFITESPQEANSMKKLYKWKDNFNYMVTWGAWFKWIKEKPKSRLNIDMSSFEPIFEHKTSIFGGRTYDWAKNVNNIISAAKKADQVWIATDDDEMWHYIGYMLYDDFPKAIKDKTFRFMIWSYSYKEIEKSVKTLKKWIDFAASDKWKAYRVLDKVVWRWLSPMMWKFGNVMSSWRVQAPAVKAIVDKEKEIKAFVPEKYVEIKAKHNWFDSLAYSTENKVNKFRFFDKIEKIKEALNWAKEARVKDITIVDKQKGNPIPYVMTTAINDIIAKTKLKKRKAVENLLNWMKVAKIGEALTTYPRTNNPVLKEVDSVFGLADKLFPNLSERHNFSMKWRTNRNKGKNINENHGWIEPENIGRLPNKVDGEWFSPQEKDAYRLIWNRTIATQLKPAKIREYWLILDINWVEFRANFKIILERNYLEVYNDIKEEDYVTQKLVNDIINFKKEDNIDVKKIEFIDKETQPPKRFTQATLINFLKSKGITRPSTESNTYDLLLTRWYADVQKWAIYATEVAFRQNEAMTKSAPEFLEYSYTNEVENQLDDIQFEKVKYKQFMGKFFKHMQTILQRNWFWFNENWVNKYTLQDWETDANQREQKIIGKCPKCKKDVVELMSARWKKYIKCIDTKWNNKKKDWIWCWYQERLDAEWKIIKQERKVIGTCPKCKKEVIEVISGKWRKYKKCIDTKWSMKERDWIGCWFQEWIDKIELKIIGTCPNCSKNVVEVISGKWKKYKRCEDTKWSMKERAWVGCWFQEWIDKLKRKPKKKDDDKTKDTKNTKTKAKPKAKKTTAKAKSTTKAATKKKTAKKKNS